MKITIIGKGNVAQALREGFERTGHTVTLAGRDPAEIASTSKASDLVVLAIPYASAQPVIDALGDAADGKIVIDAINPVTPEFDLALGFETSFAEELQAQLPKAKVTKAFNTNFAGTMASGSVNGEKISGLVAGNDAQAKAIVLGLLSGLGFDAIDAGPLANARLLEPFALMTIRLGLAQGYGFMSGFRLIRARV